MPIAGKSNILKNMEFLITRTAAGLSRYPLHRHDVFEIVCYLAGDGIMRSDAGDAQTLAEMLYRCSLDGEMQKKTVWRAAFTAPICSLSCRLCVSAKTA